MRSGGEKTYVVANRTVRCLNEDGKQEWVIEGREYQRDGPPEKAGFTAEIHAVVADGNGLLLTDGSWVRKVNDQGTVTTTGGQPLGKEIRRYPPLLLGLVTRDRDTFVADFSLRKVFRIASEKANGEHEVKEVYRSPRRWSPTGVVLSGEDLIILEYRPDTLLRRLLHRLGCGEYLRICQAPIEKTSEPNVHFTLSHRQARSALRAFRNPVLVYGGRPKPRRRRWYWPFQST